MPWKEQGKEGSSCEVRLSLDKTEVSQYPSTMGRKDPSCSMWKEPMLKFRPSPRPGLPVHADVTNLSESNPIAIVSIIILVFFSA